MITVFSMHYAWLIWNIILIAVWLTVFFSLRDQKGRKEMLLVSLWTAPFGLTEPLYVPAYWNPPSLFDLAQRTGFDIESILFTFGVAGLAVVLYEKLFPVRHHDVSNEEKYLSRHRYHILALLSGPLIFVVLMLVTNLNPIYSTIIALLLGGIATWYCRPDLKKKMIASAFLFLGFYFVYFLTLIALFPGYVERVWNLKAISGVLILGIPLEELLFAFALGFMWSSVYEHVVWKRVNDSL